MMECHDVRQLLAFVNRPCEELDASERDAIQQHLEKCLDCAELAHADHHADEVLGSLMRTVAVPADLKHKVLKRLAVERGSRSGKWIAAAAAIFIAVSAWGAWSYLQPTDVYNADLISFVLPNPDEVPVSDKQWSEDEAEAHLKAQGLRVRVPREFDYTKLRQVVAVDFKGRRVAQLTFSQPNDCAAVILILPWRQFRTGELAEDPTGLDLISDQEHKFTYLIIYRGSLKSLQRQQSIF